MNFFPFSWQESRDEFGKELVRCFGWNEKSEYCCLSITDFNPYIYVKIKEPITDMKKIKQVLLRPTVNTRAGTRMKTIQYKGMKTLKARGLYFFSEDPEEKQNYCLITFKNNISRMCAAKALSPFFQVCENRASVPLQLCCTRRVNISDWFLVVLNYVDESDVKTTSCDAEFIVHWKNIGQCSKRPSFIPSPRVMSYDIETFAHDLNIFPDPKHPKDEIFQISIVLGGAGAKKKILLTLGTPDDSYLDEEIELRTFATEKKMLLHYADLVRFESPQILIGYNTFGFDNKFMIERAKMHGIFDDFSRQGYLLGERAPEFTSGWTSSAFSNQEFCFLDASGRIHADMMLFIMRECEKMNSYKLNSVAMHFLGAKKDPLNHYHIRECYLKGMEHPAQKSRALAYVGKYCVKDSSLVLDLYDKLNFWQSVSSMASVCSATITDLFTHAQTKKIFCQVYKFCSERGIIVENDVYRCEDDEIVEGAVVLDPKIGLYNNVVSFDFASLYPSIIISHNIDFSTLVPEDAKIDDSQCHIVEWEEHYGCACKHAKPVKKLRDGRKIVICKKKRIRWIKEPKGVIPTVIENLLRARKEVKAQMKKFDPESLEYSLLNRRQLALKVSANSMFGGFSSRFGSLQFLVGGMSITAIGRKSVKKVSEIMERSFGADVIYGDTDSIYVRFLRSLSPEELYTFCAMVSDEVSAHFPKPMRLEFEGKIYEKYFLFTKKRYIYKLIGKDDLVVSGVLLKRRDSAPIVKRIYGDLVNCCLEKMPESELFRIFFQHINALLAGFSPPSDFAIGSSVKTIDKFPIRPKSDKKVYCGCYTVPILSEEPKKRAEQFKKKGVQTEQDFYLKSLPNVVQLALKMRARGQSVQNGERISFIYTKGHAKALSVDKMEDLEYFEQFCKNDMIDTSEYMRLLCETPLNELFSVYLQKDMSNFFTKIWKVGLARNNLNDEYKRRLLAYEVIFSPSPEASKKREGIEKYFNKKN